MSNAFDLSQDAIKIRISCGQAGTHVKLPAISEEVAQQHGIAAEDVQASIVVLRKVDTERIQQKITGLRATLKRRTFPWDDLGWRGVTLSERQSLLKELNQGKDDVETIVREGLVNRYDEIRADAKQRLNGLFGLIRFPTKEELAEKYYVKIEEEPIINVNDVRLRHTDPHVVDEIKAKTQALLSDKLKGAQQDLVERIEEMAQRVASLPIEDRLPNGKKIRWHDTAITNIKDNIDILESLNLTGDPKMAAVIKKLRENLASLNPDSLRKSRDARANAVNRALSILDDLDEVAGRQKKQRAKAQPKPMPALAPKPQPAAPPADLNESYVSKTMASILGLDPSTPITRKHLEDTYKGMPGVVDQIWEGMKQAAKQVDEIADGKPAAAPQPEPEAKPASEKNEGSGSIEDLLSMEL